MKKVQGRTSGRRRSRISTLLGRGGREIDRRRDEPLLDIRDIALRFGGIIALDGVSRTIGDGQILGLIGPNGAGRMTLFNRVSRLYTPNRRHIC